MSPGASIAHSEWSHGFTWLMSLTACQSGNKSHVLQTGQKIGVSLLIEISLHRKLGISCRNHFHEVCACKCRLLECWQQPALQRQGNCPESCQPGAYIISGGLGSLGLLVTTWLTQSHPSQPHAAALLGRTGRGLAAEEAAAAAAEAAIWLCIVRCDAAMQEEAVAAIAYSQVRHLSARPSRHMHALIDMCAI